MNNPREKLDNFKNVYPSCHLKQPLIKYRTNILIDHVAKDEMKQVEKILSLGG